MDAHLAVLVGLSVLTALVVGVVIFVIVELARARTGHARALLGRLALSRLVQQQWDGAERLRLDLGEQIALTRHAVDRAAASGVPVGELRQIVAEIASHADRWGEQLTVASRTTPGRGGDDHLAQLQDHHGQLCLACGRIRAALVDGELLQSATDLGTTVAKADIEIAAARAANDALGGSVVARMAEIDEIYRRELL